MNKIGMDTVDEVVNILHINEFSLWVFKGLVKCSRYCEFSTEEDIKKNTCV